MKKYIMIFALVFSTNAIADTTCDNQGTWFEKEWCETVEFQKTSWNNGKEQVNNTFNQIADGVTKVMTTITSNN